MPLDANLMGARLKALRLIHDCKQDEVARGLGLKQGAVSAHEMGVSVPSARQLYWYAERYNVSVDYILGLTDDPRPTKRADPEKDRPPINKTLTLLTQPVQDGAPAQDFRELLVDILSEMLPQILPEVLISTLERYTHRKD